MKLQSRIAASVLKRSQKRVKLSPQNADQIKEAITKADMRSLIKKGLVKPVQKKGISRVRARKSAIQKAKGRRKGQGSRKGTHNARLSRKKEWIDKVRLQRKFLREVRTKELISNESYRQAYNKSKGGFFRSLRHLKLYLNEHSMLSKKQ